MSLHKDVKRFNKKFGMMVNNRPTHLTDRKLQERIKFMQEELDEFTKGANEQNMDEMADALVDIVYVAIGTAIMMGLPWKKLWKDVQRANMAKVRGVGKRGNLVDCIKPAVWVPPKTGLILDAAGYNINQRTQPYKDDPEYDF